MGGGLSGSRKIAISKRKVKCGGKSTACCSRNVQHPQPQVTEKYGQVCLANKNRNHDRSGIKNCCRPPEPKIQTFVKNVTPVSCQTSIGSVTGGSGVNAHSHYEIVINCGNNLEKGVDFFERNACRVDHEGRRDTVEIDRKNVQPHLHGYLNGVPMIMELYQHNDSQENPDDVTKKNLAPNSHLESSVTKATPCDKGQKRFRSSVGRQKSSDRKPVDLENGNRKNQGTSPMRKIKSANTSPCSYSKECLSEGYEFSSSKCSSVKHQCTKKCAEKEKAELLAVKNSDSDRKKNERKKPDKKNAKSSKTTTKKKERKPWISPPIPALKSEPLSDPSAVPRHIWYGDKAYAYVDEEPKPKNTFNSENTGGKSRGKKESKKRVSL
ncbi:uncharacterized protein LOC105689278 [Athalia rosae]|uniref:uncharacterized protein LOC105689278 n=1 Tax=Athalia rosae TaxID=37344 RepID=UPI0020349D29|nr:uncharacterized protein LOC105689278 [Athalia rosae]